MILIILLSRKCGLNPDNIATPIAAALGDLTTLTLLSYIVEVKFPYIYRFTRLPIRVLFYYLYC